MLRRFLRGSGFIRRILKMKLEYGFPFGSTIMSLLEYEYFCRRIPQRNNVFMLPCGCRVLLPMTPKEMYRSIIFTYSEIFLYGEYLKMPEYRVCKNDIVLDIGAFVGLYTLTVVHKARLVIAVEPNAIAYKILEYNVQLNNFRNKVIPVNKALADYEGVTSLYIEDWLMSGATLFDHWHKHYGHRRTIPVKVTTLDNLLENLHMKSVDLMKIDVEGAEILVLCGATETLSNYMIQKIVMEVHTDVCNINKVINILKAYKYRIDLIERRRDTALLYAKLRV